MNCERTLPNQYSRKVLDSAAIAIQYDNGTSLVTLASINGVNKRRIIAILLDSNRTIRTPWSHLNGNDHALTLKVDREDLYRLYVTEQRSISYIEHLLSHRNIRYHLIRLDIPIRGYAETRIGMGDNLSPESREKVTDSHRGAKNWNWKGGITETDKLFYQSPEWKSLSLACKQRDHFHCQQCSRILRPHQLRAHHIVYRSDSGPDTLENLITYCNPCHRRLHNIAHRANVLRRGFSDSPYAASILG